MSMTHTGPTPVNHGEIGVKGQNVNHIQADTVTVQWGGATEIQANTVHISQGGVTNLKADQVELRQAGAQNVNGQSITVRQGGIVQARTGDLSMSQGGLILAETQTATLTASNVGAILSGGAVTLDQSMARAVLTRGDVAMDQSGTGVLLARQVKTGNNTGVFLMIAGRVDGPVNAVFGPGPVLVVQTAIVVIFRGTAMPVTFFRIIWPFLRGYFTRKAAERVANYLQTRREQRLKKSPDVMVEPVADSGSFSMANAVWYTLSGVLLGGALGLIVTKIFRQED